MVSAINPAARTGWIPANRLDHLARIGTLYVPDPVLPKGQGGGFVWDLVRIPSSVQETFGLTPIEAGGWAAGRRDRLGWLQGYSP
jgi:hypothetical protein